VTTAFGYCAEAPLHWTELLDLVRWLEHESNFDSFWLPDALLPNGPPDEPRLDAWTALAALARETSRLRLGALVSGNAFRHPSLLAKIVTTLDHISDGRVTLGIGAGWPGEHHRFGIEFWSRPERLARFEEAVQVIELLWTQPRPTFSGAYYQLDQPPYGPANVQRPRPPILIGGGSEPMLRAIAKYADLASPMIDVAVAVEKVGAYCREIGRDPSEIRWTGGGTLYLNDDVDAQRRAIAFAVKQWGTTEEQVRDGLFGSLEDVRAGVRRQLAAGVQEVIIFQLPRLHKPSLVRFSEAIIPAFT
jgi:alkanesulfonate monooxygenase SsuD/methylene tetrahydromethanopterin reductase-like flavin-dependent oxidoreductase (luciferase family)